MKNNNNCSGDSRKGGSSEVQGRAPEFEDEWSGLPRGRFSVILADPPWTLRNVGRAPAPHDGTMSLQEVADMPVPDLAAPDCALFLWVPGVLRAEAARLMWGWGFTCEEPAVCSRPGFGAVDSSRDECDFLFFGVRGGGPRFQGDILDDEEWSPAVLTLHTREAREVYDLIERWFVGPYLELFARSRHQGWITRGDEIFADGLGEGVDGQRGPGGRP